VEGVDYHRFLRRLTTFSTFLRNGFLFQEGRIGWALMNVAINMLGSFAMTGIAFWLFSSASAHNSRTVNVGLIFSVTLDAILNEGDRMKQV
jgi:hypothetical protein